MLGVGVRMNRNPQRCRCRWGGKQGSDKSKRWHFSGSIYQLKMRRGERGDTVGYAAGALPCSVLYGDSNNDAGLDEADSRSIAEL